MTKARGRGTRKLPDMSEGLPEAVQYKPPDKSMGSILDYPIDLATGHYLVIRQHIYRENAVDFAVMQFYEDDDGRYEVARIDCCHGEVHRHGFKRNSKEETRHSIQQITVDGSQWATVNTQYESCLEKMTSEFMENYRRWAD